jgi:hypothetical protein
VDVVRDFDDVQRLFMVLHPDDYKYRLIVIGRKKLPKPGPYQRFWGVVESVADDAAQIEKEFAPYEYETKTRGVRRQKAARLITTGSYAIYHHDDHSHLNFNVAEPDADFGFHIPTYGEYVITAKNYDYQDLFGGYRFQPLLSTEVLDYDGSQLVIIAANHGIQALSNFPQQRPWPLAL